MAVERSATHHGDADARRRALPEHVATDRRQRRDPEVLVPFLIVHAPRRHGIDHRPRARRRRSWWAGAFVSAASLLLSAIPLLGGLRLTHAGDPEMGRRFVSDLRARVGQLRHPIGLVRTSAGLAFVTALVSVPVRAVSRDGGDDRYRVGPAGRPDPIHPAGDGVPGSDGVIRPELKLEPARRCIQGAKWAPRCGTCWGWRDSCPSPSASDCWGQGSTA
jgi:hypothetical protein